MDATARALESARISVHCDGSVHMFAMVLPVGGTDVGLFEVNDPSLPPGPLRPRTNEAGANAGAQVCNDEAIFLRPPGTWDLLLRRDAAPFTSWSMPRKTLELKAGESLMLTFSESDFKSNGSCCHCPFASVFDFARGADRPAFEVLEGRDASTKRGEDRYRLSIPVRNHEAVVRIRELETEVTFLKGLALEDTNGRRVIPSTVPHVTLRKGEEATFVFRLDDTEDAEVDRALVVEGYYLPER
jgi:hypothetical protein